MKASDIILKRDERKTPFTIEEVLKLFYLKHLRGDDSVGWEELEDIICDAMDNHLGYEESLKFKESIE